MVDTYKNIEGWLEDYYTGVENWRLLTHVKTDRWGRIGLHIQREIGDWRGLAGLTIPTKFLAGIQNIVTVKRINGESFPVWRQWVEHQGSYLDDLECGAKRYIDTFRDSMEEVLEQIATDMPGLPIPWFGVESLNETYACWDPSVITHSIPFDRAFIRALMGYPEVSPIVYCAAVGNIQLPEEDPDGQAWQDLVEMGHECEAANGCYGYHSYWFANPDESGLASHWPYLAGRWTEFDKYLSQHGNAVEVNWFFGECGAVGGRYTGGGYQLLPHDGWKSSQCYGGNWSRYEADLLEFNGRVQAWNATHNNRAFGGTVFTTTGGGYSWDSFEIGESEIERLKVILGCL